MQSVARSRARRAGSRGPQIRGSSLSEVINPFVLYAGIALGAVGVLLALPRKRINPQVLGALIGAVALGVVLVGLGVRAGASDALPNIYFYVFSAIALGSCLRVITHQRPVYAALYFILAILASSGLYLILSAEFMAFALIIIYAGAILITYLFVIMLATEAPSEEELDRLADYDAVAREPMVATGVGFVLLAVLTTMLFSGASQLPAPESFASTASGDAVLRDLPGAVEKALRRAGLMEDGEAIARDADGRPRIDPVQRVAWVGLIGEDPASGEPVVVNVRQVSWPDDLHANNVQALAYDFLNRHPGTIEIAGVILLMAMLGAVVLSRRQVELDEEAKARQARHLHVEEPA